MSEIIPITACFARLVTKTDLKRLRQIVPGDAVHDGARDDGRTVALERGWGQLSDATALVCKQSRMGSAVMGSGSRHT